jgi:VanZ family protein
VETGARPGPNLLIPSLATLGVAALLLIPLPAPPPGTVSTLWGLPEVDKLAHLLLFLALGWIWRRSLVRADRPVSYLVIFAAVVAYGGLLELLQGASGIRTAEWGDLAADALGAGLVPLWRWAPAQSGGDAAGGASEVASGAGGVDGAPVDSR